MVRHSFRLLQASRKMPGWPHDPALPTCPVHAQVFTQVAQAGARLYLSHAAPRPPPVVSRRELWSHRWFTEQTRGLCGAVSLLWVGRAARLDLTTRPGRQLLDLPTN